MLPVERLAGYPVPIYAARIWVKCLKCGCVWITRANYVEQTPNKDGQKRLFDYEKSNIERQQRK